MELDANTLNLARSMFPPVAGEHGERDRRFLETAVTALVGLQLSANAAAVQLCTQPDGDHDLNDLTLRLRNQLTTFAHFLEVYRAFRDKPEVLS